MRKVRGKVDLARLISQEPAWRMQLEIWEQAADRVAASEMPPEDEPQPTDAERARFAEWYRSKFASVDTRPGRFRVRRYQRSSIAGP